MNFATILQVWSAIVGLWHSLQAFLLWLAKRDAEQTKAEVKEATEELKQANGVKDDETRIQAKSDAACRLERLSNSDADCTTSTDRK